MSNNDYLQWEPMLKKIAFKYRNNTFGLEISDLMQIGAIGLMYGFDTFKEDAGASKKSYFYNCIEWRIIREFTNLKRAKRFCDSQVIYLDAYTDDEKSTTAAEIIPSDINIEEKVLSKIKVKQYIDEIEKYLKAVEKDIVMYKLFDDLTNQEIALACNVDEDKINGIYYRARKKLIEKSDVIAIYYYKILINREINFNDYGDPEVIARWRITLEGYKNSLKSRNKKNNSNKYSA